MSTLRYYYDLNESISVNLRQAESEGYESGLATLLRQDSTAYGFVRPEPDDMTVGENRIQKSIRLLSDTFLPSSVSTVPGPDEPEMNDYVPYEQRPETYIVPVVFALIFIVGIVGNGTLVVIFLRHRAMRNIPNT
ncbi:hypothetical protein AND_005097 [Anopheles darlingi]|uniref:G-protein coupled receptors family 1 profile domain-containing protein n=2 Tax=Anopheles darlingi TaxID=43151 RepID=W5JGH6_ANODA|nr:hypothetical protein AND_005097 [Anopheles darlingi]